jgi:hypothetical protein
MAPEFLSTAFPDFCIDSYYAMVWPGMKAADTGIVGLHEELDPPRNFCDHPFYDLGVRANGDIVMCCYDISGKEVMGNILQNDILELYQSDKYVGGARCWTMRPIRCRRFVAATLFSPAANSFVTMIGLPRKAKSPRFAAHSLHRVRRASRLSQTTAEPQTHPVPIALIHSLDRGPGDRRQGESLHAATRPSGTMRLACLRLCRRPSCLISSGGQRGLLHVCFP